MLIVFIICALLGVLTLVVHITLELNKLDATAEKITEAIRTHYESC